MHSTAFLYTLYKLVGWYCPLLAKCMNQKSGTKSKTCGRQMMQSSCRTEKAFLEIKTTKHWAKHYTKFLSGFMCSGLFFENDSLDILMKYILCKCFIIASCEIFNVYTNKDFPNFISYFPTITEFYIFYFKQFCKTSSLESELIRGDPCMLVNVFHSGRTI